jgi:hypothetical protein
MFSITTDDTNKDLHMNMTRHDGRKYYLDLWGNDFKSKFGPPVVEEYNGKYILRADLAPGGLKSFGGERVIANGKPTLVYCAPRQGHAPDAIASVAKMYDKKVVFFMPASKEVSDHQGALFAYDNVDVRFFRIAAMPVLNQYAKKWASEHQATYLPFGLTGNAMVTAGLVNMCRNISNQLGKDPTEIYCAVSTGTMTRALQIGWPEATPKGVAVARNIHKGEKGVAILESATIPFLNRAPIAKSMPIPTTAAYDAKAWELFEREGKPGSIFINVGSDDILNRHLVNINRKNINSYRDWHDMGDWDLNRSAKGEILNYGVA